MTDFAIAGLLFVGGLVFLAYSGIAHRGTRINENLDNAREEGAATLTTTSPALAALVQSHDWQAVGDLGITSDARELVLTGLRAVSHVEEDIFQPTRYVEEPLWSSVFAVDEHTRIANAPLLSNRSGQHGRTGPGVSHDCSVCVVDLGQQRPPLIVGPQGILRRIGGLVGRMAHPTGDPAFDADFQIAGVGNLSPEIRGTVMRRTDWCFFVLGAQAIGIAGSSLETGSTAEVLVTATRAISS